MTLNNRRTSILQVLASAETHILVEELMQSFNVSRRTIYYDIHKINAWLTDHHIESVEHSYSKGYFLNKNMKVQVFQALLTNKSSQKSSYKKDERVSLIGLLIILKTDCLQLTELIRQTGVSRVTTYKDLTALKQSIMNFKLSVEYTRTSGYCIKGSNSNKIKAVGYHLTRFLSQRNWEQFSQHMQSAIQSFLIPINPIETTSTHSKSTSERCDGNLCDGQSMLTTKFIETQINLSDLYRLFLEYRRRSEINVLDPTQQTLLLNVLILCVRLDYGELSEIDEAEKVAIRLTQEFAVVEKITNELKNWCGYDLSKNRLCYITRQFLRSEDNRYQYNEMESLKRVIRSMITDFQRVSSVFLHDQKELEKVMFGHMKMAYYRVKYHVVTDNPLTDHIKNKYQDVFHITKKVMFHLENLLGQPINDQEITYIALYLGGWMRRQGSTPASRRKAIIVCESSLSTSCFLLRPQLEQLLPTVDITGTISLSNYLAAKYDTETDIFVSTISIPRKDKPAIQVNPILNDRDKLSILTNLGQKSPPSKPVSG